VLRSSVEAFPSCGEHSTLLRKKSSTGIFFLVRERDPANGMERVGLSFYFGTVFEMGNRAGAGGGSHCLPFPVVR
jgi:hypothetical protein